MPDNLNRDANGEARFAYAGERPWHSLGLRVPNLMTTREAIIAGKLDYEVEKRPLFTPKGVGDQTIEVPDYFATVRKDTNDVLGVVGKGYEVVQNVRAFTFFDAALGEGAAAIETVGALGKGERIFIMAQIPEVVEIAPGDPVEHYLLLTTSHDGTGAIKVFFTPVRVVCQNTLSAALRGAKQTVSIKHTKGVEGSLLLAHELLDTSKTYWTRVRAAFKYMQKQQMNGNAVKEFLAGMFPSKFEEVEEPVGVDDAGNPIIQKKLVEKIATRTQNTRDKIEQLFDGQAIGANLAGHTRWGMYNAITHFVDWERKSRTGINQWENSIFGLGADLRQKAFDLLMSDAPQDDALLTA